MKQWKIDDTLFYPLGLFNVSSDDKTVLVAWTFDSLITQIFKKVGSDNILTDKYNITFDGTVKLITLTEFNTLILLESGDLKYFSSFKNVKSINFLKNVRYLSSCVDGFTIIRIEEGQKRTILLEHYKDIKNIERNEELTKGRKYFDITYDEVNIFDSTWEQDLFTVKAFKVDNHNQQFFGLLSRSKVNSGYIYVFSINGNIFSLLEEKGVTNQTDFILSQILAVSSDVINIEYMEQENLLLIFLSCGTLEILFESKLFKVLDRTKYYTGCEIIASAFSLESYFYSDGERIVKLNFKYDNESNKLDILEVDQFIPGIIACTWVKAIGKLICVSENNIFYRAKFSTKPNKKNLPSSKDFYELTPEKFKKFEQNSQLIVSLTKAPENINKLIYEEINKQTIISVASRKDLYSQLISCSIEFHSFIPTSLKGNIIYPTETYCYDIDSFFGLIYLEIKPNEIFINDVWNLVINFSNSNEKCFMKIIKLSKLFQNKLITIVLHLKKYKILIPKIEMELNTVVSCDDDLSLVSIPIEISRSNFSNLFQNNVINYDFRSKNYLKENLEKIFNENFISIETKKKIQFQYIKKTPTILKGSEVCDWFNYKNYNNINSNEHIKFTSYFFGVKLTIEYNDVENLLKILTVDPFVLYHTKMLVAEKLAEDIYESSEINFNDQLRCLYILQAQIQDGEQKLWDQLSAIYSTLRNKIIL